jgi:hypothetical protein
VQLVVDSGTGVRLRLEKRKKGFLFRFFPKKCCVRWCKMIFLITQEGNRPLERMQKKYIENTSNLR